MENTVLGMLIAMSEADNDALEAAIDAYDRGDITMTELNNVVGAGRTTSYALAAASADMAVED